MKIRKALPLLLAAASALLTSCSPFDESALIAKGQSIYESLQAPSDTVKFKGHITGHLKTLWNSEDLDGGEKTKNGTYGDTESLLIHAPTSITGLTFYVDPDVDSSGYDDSVYGTIYQDFIASDSLTHLTIDATADGGMVFSVTGSNMTKKRIFTIESSFLEVSAKLDMSLTYDANGLLVEEKVSNVNSGYTDDVEGTIDLTCVYERR